MSDYQFDDFRSPDKECGITRGLACFRGYFLVLSGIGILILAGIYFAQDQIDPVIQILCEKKLGSQLAEQGVAFELGGARFVEGQGIILDDVRLFESSDQHRLIATIKRVELVSRIKKIKLLEGHFQPDEIVLSGFDIDARPDEAGWNVQRLWIKPDESMQPVPLRIRDSSISLFADATSETPVTEMRDVQMHVEPRFDHDVATSFALEGSFRGNETGNVRFAGGVVPYESKWGVAGKATGMKLDSSLLDKLPAGIAAKVPEVENVSGRIDCQFNVSVQDPGRFPEFEVTGNLTRGRVADPRLPVPLSELAANFTVNNRSVVVNDITAETTFGKLDLTFNKRGLLNAHGLLEPGPIVLTANMPRLFLNERLAANAPKPIQELWSQYLPSGPVNLNAIFVYENGTWKHDCTFDLLGVALTYYKLPYRLEGCRGRISWSNERLIVDDMSALAAGAIVHFDGNFRNPGPYMTGRLEFRVDGQVPVDEKLISALTPNPSLYKTVRQFRPTGLVSGSGWIERTLDRNLNIIEDKDYTIRLNEGTVVYEHFPYPFSGINGTIRVKNDLVLYQNIEGQNGSGHATCNGRLDPRNGLTLTFNLHSIELEEELRQALSTDLQSIWSDIRPRGSIDHAIVILNKPPQRDLEINLRLEKFKQTELVQRDPLSVFPTWFPYRTTDVVGMVDYQNGRLTIHGLSGKHGDTRLGVAGGGQFNEKGWFIDLTSLNFDRLTADADFIAALPKQFGDAIKSLEVKGMLTVGGWLRISDEGPQMAAIRKDPQVAQVAYLSEINRTAEEEIPPPRMPTFNWDLRVDMADGGITTALPLTNIYGGARFIGTSNASGFYSSGRIDADSLLCRGVPLTDVSGPIWVDATRIGLGGWAAPVKVESERQLLTANMFGGKVTLDAMVALSEEMPFQVQARVDRADLQQTMLELSPRSSNIEGLGFAAVKLSGDRRGSHTYKGSGSLRLTSARISEVPVMLAMLKLLSVKQVDRTAFNESNIDFSIDGDHCYFQRLEFLGDAISLKGNGEMSFDQDIKLNFYTGVGKGKFQIPVISPLFGVASQNILLVQVDGTLTDPQVSKRLFPRLDDQLKEMFPDLEREVQSAK